MKKALLLLGLAVIFASACQAEMIFGYDITSGMPFMGFQVNENQRADVGLTYTSLNDGNTTNLGLMGKFENTMLTAGQLKAGWAGVLGIASGKAAGTDTTTITLSGLLTAEYKVSKNLGVYGSIYLLTFQNVNTGGTSATNFWLLTGDGANAYGGIRVYI